MIYHSSRGRTIVFRSSNARKIVKTMASARLANLISGPVLKNDAELAKLLFEADHQPHAILIATDISKNSTEYINPGVEDLFGYSMNEMIKGGIPLIALITAQNELPRLSALQAVYAQQAQEVSFDPTAVIIQEYRWTAIHKDGTHIPVASIGCVLQYTEHREFGLGIGFFVRTDQLPAAMASCHELLVKIKERHSEISSQPAFTPQAPYRHNYLHNEYTPLSTREREVLNLLALGFSTKEISIKLNISTHTAESHRKHLLDKFEAKNSAELIMKASKMYWFK